MVLRATTGQATDLALSRLNSQSAQLRQAQIQLSTGERLHRPSDDPLAVRHALLQQDQISRLEATLTATNRTQSRLSQAHVQLRDAQQLFVKAREIGLSARQATDASERKIFADEVQGLLDQLINIANSSDESGYLFAGTETRQRPFAFNDAGDQVTYSGTPFSTELHLSADADRSALAPGDRIFLSTSRGDTAVIGNTGITAGAGIDTAHGKRDLIVTHTSTTYSAGGVTAGTSSVGGDTIVGASGTHTLVINDTSGTGASGTISLNGGAEIAFTNADTDLQLLGPTGEVVYVDTTAITPGFSGSVDITANGTVSIDGGATTTSLDFSTNQQITDSRDGTVVHLNGSTVKYSGTDTVEFPGTSSAFTALINLRDELLAGDDKSSTEFQEAIGRRLTEVERVEGHLLDEIGVQSVSIQNLDRLVSRTEDLKLDETIAHAENTNADLAAATLELQELLNLQQFTFASVSRILQPSLLQFLQ